MTSTLLDAVRANPILWDKSRNDYFNKIKKEKVWAEVAQACGITGKWTPNCMPMQVILYHDVSFHIIKIDIAILLTLFY